MPTDTSPARTGFRIDPERSIAGRGFGDLLSKAEVCKRLGRSNSTLYRDIREGRIPQPVKIGRASRWLSTEIDAVIARAVAERDGEDA